MELTEALRNRRQERQKARQALDTILEKNEVQKPDKNLDSQKVYKPIFQSLKHAGIDFEIIPKVFTTGIKAEDFLSALNPENGTYFGLAMETTHITKEQLELFGKTLGQALDKNKSFTFQCYHLKERNELAIMAATMLTEGWMLKLDNMAVRGEPYGGSKGTVRTY